MKKITYNTIALGNLKQRHKQYTIMIIGIILAMVFSSSIVFFMFSASETSKEYTARREGKQSCIVYSEDLGEEEYEAMVNAHVIDSFGFAHIIGYVYKDESEKKLGASISWLDDKAKELSYQIITEGTLPINENEIAAEKSALMRIGCKDAKIGDTISLFLDIQNGDRYLKTVKKEYKLVGILEDKKCNIEYRYSGMDEYETMIPGFFVADNTRVELGGKEKLTAYIAADFSIFEDEFALDRYIGELTDDYQINRTIHSTYMLVSFDDLFSGGDYAFLVILVLIFASCVAIVNAFNSNLKERKKQIGLLRAVGTTRRQVIKIFGREAFIITLICVPVSILLSYGIVRVLVNLISEDAIMTKSIWALPVSAIINIAVVMLASLIPLFVASRITPMQAIRNISNTRKVKTKRIKTKMLYDAPRHIAKRNLRFYSLSRLAVSVMLAATIILSCFGFSAISFIKENMRNMPYDYALYTNSYEGISEFDKQAMASMPYFSKVIGTKQTYAIVEYEEIDDFFRVFCSDNFLCRNGLSPTSDEELADYLKNNQPDNDYNKIKNELGIDSEYIHTTIVATEYDILKRLNEVSYDGKVDLSKLDSGEEVILIAPKKAEFVGYVYNHGYGYGIHCDDDIGKKEIKYNSILTAESNYKAGDMITIDISQENYDEKTDILTHSIKTSKEAKIGAIVSPNDVNEINIDLYDNYCIVTSKNGLEHFKKGVNYDKLYFYTDLEIDDETDEEITSEFEFYSQKYGAYFTSNYRDVQSQKNEYYMGLATMISIIIISFVICASVINNSISARIRENKKVIGTLRAVGADQGAVVKSYIIQMMSMFSWGIGIGFGVYLAGFFVMKIIYKYFYVHINELTFNPWFAIGMVILLFLICSVNLWIKVRKEMKNSIVENIREL